MAMLRYVPETNCFLLKGINSLYPYGRGDNILPIKHNNNQMLLQEELKGITCAYFLAKLENPSYLPIVNNN